MLQVHSSAELLCWEGGDRRRGRKGRRREEEEEEEEGEKEDRRRRGRRRGRRRRKKRRRRRKKREKEEADVYSVTSGVQEQRPVVLAAVQAEFNNNAIYTASIKLHTPYSLIHSH